MRRGIGLPQRAPQSLAPRHAVGAPAATASARRRPPGIAWRPSTCLGAHRRPLIVGEAANDDPLCCVLRAASTESVWVADGAHTAFASALHMLTCMHAKSIASRQGI
eukprot:365742-Chlamydomonas_euryale.AAC.6